MFYDMIVFVILATSPALTNVVKESFNTCSLNEFSCDDGACVSLDRICNGFSDCADSSDEQHCEDGLANTRPGNLTLIRSKRQTSTCRKTQWRCRDGTCIAFDGRCDGMINCPDKSDETHALCRNSQCQENWFRCTYGACVDGTAPCNGVQECADNSDELLPSCRNDTDEIKGRFKCQDGSFIPAWNRCDGEVNCPDGSDETVRACADKTCQTHLFQCAYGACVDQGSDCNGVNECADGSDEDNELCGREVPVITTPPPPKDTDCVLPPYPERGIYEATQAPNASPGQVFKNAQLNYTCIPGYDVVGEKVVSCFYGVWTPRKMPECVRHCKLKKDASVKYRCLIKGSNDAHGDRNCKDQEPIGTSVRPVCNTPNYYSTGILPNMKCYEDGSWDYVATCFAGLSKNGTNITILIKDKVVVYVSNFQYGASVNNDNAAATNSVEFNINGADWKRQLLQNTTNLIHFNINNSNVLVNSDDRIHFRDNM